MKQGGSAFNVILLIATQHHAATFIKSNDVKTLHGHFSRFPGLSQCPNMTTAFVLIVLLVGGVVLRRLFGAPPP
jgi:hypothetical protein